MGETEWREGDEYYWAGAPGWTICRVWVDGGYRHELWYTRKGVGRLVGARASFQGTVALYEQQAAQIERDQAQGAGEAASESVG